MQIDLKHQTWFLYWVSACLVIQTVMAFSTFPFLMPLTILQRVANIVNFCLMGFLYLRAMRMTKFGLLAFLYLFLLVVFSLFSSGEVSTALARMMEVFTLLMAMLYFQDHLDAMLRTMAVFFSLAIYSNGLLMVLFPDWMFAADDAFDSFLLGGNYNQMGGRIMPALVLNCMCVRYNWRWSINVIGLFAVSIATLAFVGSMTALSSVVVFGIFCLLPTRRLQIAAMVSLLVVYVLFQCVVVFSGEGLYNNELASYLIKDVLGKDMTFTNRTSLWDAAGKAFAESPLIGYGWVTADWYVSHMSADAIGPHNFIYNVLLNGGLTLISVFLGMVALALHSILPCADRYGRILIMGALTLAFMMLMEVYPFFYIFMLLAYMYYYPSLYRRLRSSVYSSNAYEPD